LTRAYEERKKRPGKERERKQRCQIGEYKTADRDFTETPTMQMERKIEGAGRWLISRSIAYFTGWSKQIGKMDMDGRLTAYFYDTTTMITTTTKITSRVSSCWPKVDDGA
jgi:hypothetical protein